ncbi:mitochondrial inner membrane protein-domain-containing protein [Myxozyma melibiosi]|uniref:MICOS complex subunit MIC60 n=1 Tax=Myxozyma melibiosi TaxID=54550 RepID=A0ABR1FDB9_9ASCO
MLRITAARAASASGQIRIAQTARLLSTSTARLNIQNQPPSSVPPAGEIPVPPPAPVVEAPKATPIPPPPPPPKTHRLRTFLFLSFLAASLYGTGVWYSTVNDNFHDFFTEYVPLGEEIVMMLEEREFQRRFPNAGRKAASGDSPRVTIHRGGATWKVLGDEYKGPNSGPHISAKTPAAAPPKKETSAPAPAAATESKPAAAAKETALPQLPKLIFDGTIDPALEDVVKSINGLFTVLSKTGKAGPEELGGIAASLGQVSDRFVKVKAKYEADLKGAAELQSQLIAAQAAADAEEAKKQLAALDEQWKQGYFAERKRLIDTYKQRLTTELKKFAALFDTRVKNEVISAATLKEKEFAAQVSDKVETERSGKLARLGEVKKAFEEVVELSKEVDKLLDASEKAADLQLALGALSNALATPYQVPLAPLLARIKIAAGDDPLVASVIEAFPRSAYEGVLSPQQLAARFRLIAPEIRKVSLVPEDAGVAGFAGSWLLSSLLWKKEGKPVGGDVESILARAETALMEGQVEQAVREVNSLDGWRKKLAEDWLAEGRKRSEVEFLAQVLSEEGKIWQYRV